MGKYYLPHGRRVQETCLSFIEERLLSECEDTSVVEVLKMAKVEFGVPIRTLRRWLKHLNEFGEYPFETQRRMKEARRKYKQLKVTKIVTKKIIDDVKQIVDDHPEFYLDEIQNSLCVKSQVLLSIPTIHRILKNKLRYSLQVCHEAAAQRNELEREQFRTALECLISHPNQVLFVDETHKDRQASWRRKAWGKRNSGGVVLKRWFQMKARYTMIASLDINGFIDATVDCVLRRDREEEPDTVDEEYFISWVENYL